jgi:hypothetical protein
MDDSASEGAGEEDGSSSIVLKSRLEVVVATRLKCDLTNWIADKAREIRRRGGGELGPRKT